jgi:opacity protein-like surface antigen
MSRPASAADLAPMFVRKAPVPIGTAPVPVHDRWTGFYVGAHLGYGWGSKVWVDNFPVYDGAIDADTDVNGVLGGLQFGYNYRIGWLVLGVEGDFSWSDVHNTDFNCYSFGDQICSARIEWFADITGRIGAVYGPALYYVKGGAIWVDDRFTNLATCAGSQPISIDGISAACGDTFHAEQSRLGWLVGGGVEAYVARNWSVKLEYNYMNLGARNVPFEDENGNVFTSEIHQRVQLVKLGFNYHFDPAPKTVSALGFAGSRALAQANGAAGSRWVAFTGFDASKDSYSAWAGALIAPFAGLDTSGIRVLILGEGGAYSYPVTGGSIDGIMTGGSLLAGYGFEGDNYSINLLAGGNAANHMLSAVDTENSVQGTAFGVQAHADARVNPTPSTLVYGEGSYSTAFRAYYANTKFGIQIANITGLFIGPEAGVLGDRHSIQWRLGAHLTEFTVGPVQVGLSAGYAKDSDVGASPYGHIELSSTF